MSGIKKYILVLFACAMCFSLRAQDYVSFYDGTDLHLRWKGAQTQGLEGYKIYTGGEGNWSLLQETERLVSNTEIKNVVGPVTPLFLQLAGVTTESGDFTQEIYDALAANNEAYQFFGAMTAINPSMAQALGEYVKISMSESGNKEFKINYIANGSEQDLLTFELDQIRIQSIESPSNLESFPGNQNVLLQCKEPADGNQVLGYYIYRATSLIGPFQKLNPVGGISFSQAEVGMSYFDDYLENGKTYYYYLTFYNAFGIESEASEMVEVIPMPQYQLIVSGLQAHLRVGQPELNWSSEGDSISYRVYRSTEINRGYEVLHPVSERILSYKSNYLDRTAEEGVNYFYFIKAQNKDLARGYSDTISFAIPDKTAPAAPTGIKGTVTKKGIARLSWDKNKETDVLGYEVERFTGDSGINNFLLTPEPITKTIYLDDLGAKSQSAYRYVIFAIDQSYNRSEASEIIRLRRPDDIPPATPIISYLNLTDSIVSMRWTANQERDLAGYNVYRKQDNRWAKVKSVLVNSMSDTLNGTAKPEYAITAYDQDGNESPRTTSYTFNYKPEQTLDAPSNATVSDSADGLQLNWDLSADPTVIGYLIERIDQDTKVRRTMSEHRVLQGAYYDRFADPTKAYTYIITAYDKDWYTSVPLEIEYKP